MERPVEMRRKGRHPAPLQILECFFPDSECNKKYHDSMNFLKDHLIRSHFKKEIDGNLSDLQEKAGLGRDSHHCPIAPCGYFGQMRLDLIKHLALTHGNLSVVTSAYRDRVGLLKPPQELLDLVAKVKPESSLTVVTCDWCKETFSSKHLTTHQALQHFPLQYTRRLTDLQVGTGETGGRRVCPSQGCKYSVSANVQVRQVTAVLTQHMAHKHLPVDEMASSEGTSLVSCPFLEVSLKPCRTKLSVTSFNDLPLVCYHIISHVSNLLQDYTRDLLLRAKEFFPNNSELCPFGYCKPSSHFEHYQHQHVINCHREELTVLILSQVTKSDNQLIRDIQTHTVSSQAKLFISSFVSETDNETGPQPGPSSSQPRPQPLSPEKEKEDLENIVSDEEDCDFSCGICHQVFSRAKDVLEHTQLYHMKQEVKVADIFFNKTWNRKACSSWQQFFFAQDPDYQLNQYYYKVDRKCLKPNCNFYTKSPTLMLKHIRKAHVLK